MKVLIKIIGRLLKSEKLTIANRLILTTYILDSLDSLPFDSIITVSESGETLIQGTPLDVDKTRQLRESSRAALDNQALAVIRAQVAFTAVTLGVHKVTNPEQLLFARAALWWGQEEIKHLRALAQRPQELPLSGD